MVSKEELLKPFQDHRALYCGASGPKSIKFLNDYLKEMVRAGITSDDLPESGFIAKVANRICGSTVKDCLIQVSGRKGTGKSTLSVAFAYQLSKALARRMNKPKEHFFNLNHVIILSDTQSIFRALNELPDYAILILDDAGLGINARESQHKGNIQMGNILAVSRTKCWTIITTSPLRQQVDKNVRLLADLVISTFSQTPDVDGKKGFNIIKVHSVLLNNYTQKEMTPNLIGMDSEGRRRKVTLYGVLYPPQEIIEPYNHQRKAAANLVIRTIAETGDFNTKAEPPAQKPRARGVIPLAESVYATLSDVDKKHISDMTVKIADLKAEYGWHQDTIKRLRALIAKEKKV